MLDNTTVTFCTFFIKMFHKLLRLLNKDAVLANNTAGKNFLKGNGKFTWCKCWLYSIKSGSTDSDSTDSCSVTRQQEGGLLNHLTKVPLFIRVLLPNEPCALHALVLCVILCFSYLILRAFHLTCSRVSRVLCLTFFFITWLLSYESSLLVPLKSPSCLMPCMLHTLTISFVLQRTYASRAYVWVLWGDLLPLRQI